MADEEDVVFVNSPLYRHLNEVGFTDFDAQSIDNAATQSEINTNNFQPPKSSRDLTNRSFPKAIVDFVKGLFGFIFSTTSSEIAHCQSYISLIKSSKLLTEDDLEFVYRFEQCIESGTEPLGNITRHTEISESTAEKPGNFFAVVTSNAFTVFIVIIAIILALILTAEHHHWVLISFITIAVGTLLICKIYSVWWNIKIDHLNNHNLLLVKNYLKIMQELLVLVKKAVLFIQEKELLARGHIIISPLAPVARMDSNSGLYGKRLKQCTLLRECLFTEVKTYLGVLLNKTKTISCLTLFCNNKLNSWLGKDLTRIDDELFNIITSNDDTSEFSLAKLKRIFGCLIELQSLLLCHVLLILLSVVAKQSSTTENDQDIIQTCFDDLLLDGKQCFGKIKQCYKFHKVGIPQNVLDEEGVKIADKFGTTFSPFLMAIHSLSLHLQEASRTSISIEEKMEGIDSVETFVLEHFDDLEKTLLQMKCNIDSVTSCWNESHDRLQNIILCFDRKKEREKSCAEEKATRESLVDSEKDVQMVRITGIVDVVPDQIFEGETSSEIDDQKAGLSTLGSEELLREQKARDESRYLLRELKSVLATKDDQAMVGIPRALLVKKPGDIESMSIIKNKAIDLANSDKDVGLEDSSSLLNKTPESDNEQNQSVSPELKRNYDKCEDDCDSSIQFHEIEKRSNVVNPFASMVAAAALARKKQFGLKEQSYEIDCENETFGDETDSDSD